PHFTLAVCLHPLVPYVNIAVLFVLCFLPDLEGFIVGPLTVTPEYPQGQVIGAYYWVTHGLVNNLIEAAIVFGVSYLITKHNIRTSAILAGVFFSHWTLDCICMPWTDHYCPVLPLFFSSINPLDPAVPPQTFWDKFFHDDLVGCHLYANPTVSQTIEFIAMLGLPVALVWYYFFYKPKHFVKPGDAELKEGLLV
ncbi:hypothetical protein KIPB_009056, partial [Kipferlia bialata]